MLVAGDTMERIRSRIARALVVEDDAFLRRALARTIEDWGVRVTAVDSVAEGLAALVGRFDLVLVDVRLPDGDGIGVVRAASAFRPAPIVVAMSGSASAEEGWRLARAGAQAFLPKPIGVRDLAAAVQRAVEEPPPIDALVAASVGRRPLREVQADVRAVMIEQAMALADGNQSEAARLLHVTRQALQQAAKPRRRRKKPPRGDG